MAGWLTALKVPALGSWVVPTLAAEELGVSLGALGSTLRQTPIEGEERWTEVDLLRRWRRFRWAWALVGVTLWAFGRSALLSRGDKWLLM